MPQSALDGKCGTSGIHTATHRKVQRRIQKRHLFDRSSVGAKRRRFDRERPHVHSGVADEDVGAFDVAVDDLPRVEVPAANMHTNPGTNTISVRRRLSQNLKCVWYVWGVCVCMLAWSEGQSIGRSLGARWVGGVGWSIGHWANQ